MSHVISFGDDCCSYSANTSNREDLINIIEIINRNLFHWSGWTIENDIIIIDFDSVGLWVNFFWACGLRWLEFQELLKILNTGWQKLFLENSRANWKGAYISNVVFGQVFVHVFVNSCSVNIIRKNGELCGKDKILLLWCRECIAYRWWCSLSWKRIVKGTEKRNRSFCVYSCSDDLSEHRLEYTFEINLYF